MRVVQASKAYWPHVGGIETVIQQLGEGFHRRGVQSTAVVAGETRRGGTTDLNGVAVVRSATYGRVRSVPISPMFPVNLMRQRGDALLVHEPSVLPELTLAVGSRTLRRHFPRIGMWWHSDVVRQQLLLKVFGPALKRALALTDVIFTATPSHLSSSAMLGPFAEKVRFVPYGLDLSRFAPDPEIDSAALFWRERIGPKIALFVGRLVYYKGVSQLIEAVNGIPDLHLVVVGKGEDANVIDDSAAMREGRVTRIAFADDAEMRALLRAADVFILPSIANTEAFGIVQIEAMASGTPVITFDLPTGVTWVNRHGETGLVAPLSEPDSLRHAVLRLLDDDALRLRLGAEAKVQAFQRFDQETMVDDCLAGLIG